MVIGERATCVAGMVPNAARFRVPLACLLAVSICGCDIHVRMEEHMWPNLCARLPRLGCCRVSNGQQSFSGSCVGEVAEDVYLSLKTALSTRPTTWIKRLLELGCLDLLLSPLIELQACFFFKAGVISQRRYRGAFFFRPSRRDPRAMMSWRSQHCVALRH